MTIIERAKLLRKVIENLSENLNDEQAISNVELFSHWELDKAYEIGNRVSYNDTLYKCVQAHTSQADRNPEDAVSLWAIMLIPDPEVIYDWVQPESTNPYMEGDKVRHVGKIWISEIDYNVFEPGLPSSALYWTEVT